MNWWRNFAKPEHGLSIREVAGGYKMATKAEHHEAVRAFVKKLTPPLKLSLAGARNAGGHRLQAAGHGAGDHGNPRRAGRRRAEDAARPQADRAAGRKNVIGKPILYKTTKEFLVQFGLKDLSELPTLKEFEELAAYRSSEDEPDRRAAALDAPERSGGLMPEERLQKILSRAGVTSRRKAEELIVEGRVTVNGAPVTDLGSKADLDRDHIKVDGRLLHAPKHHTYIA